MHLQYFIISKPENNPESLKMSQVSTFKYNKRIYCKKSIYNICPPASQFLNPQAISVYTD